MRLNWIPGRQGTGYFKLKLVECQWPVKFDIYVLKYPLGSQIPYHTDPVPGYRHFRLNWILKRALGGVFVPMPQMGIRSYIFRSRRLVIFRPDLVPHEVTEVVWGTRMVLSIGWLRRPLKG